MTPADAVRAAKPVVDFGARPLARWWAASGWSTPRWWQSPAALAASGSDHRALVTADGDVLTVVKWRRFYAQVVGYAVLPPVSLSGDRQAVADTVDWLQAGGFGVRVLGADFAHLAAQPLADQEEYIYRVGDLAQLAGRDWHGLRSLRNQVGRRPDVTHATDTGPADGAMRALAHRWSLQRGKGGTLARHLDWVGWSPDTLTTQLLVDGQLVAFSVAERVAPGQAVLTYRVRDYEATTLSDPIGLVAHYEAMALAEAWGIDTLLTSGAAVRGGDGLAQHKARLRPHMVMAAYLLPPARPLTADDWSGVDPQMVMELTR